MTRYFTENEIEQLKELKNELLVHPRDYFFKTLNNFSEFKEIGISMSSMQWHYLRAGISLIIEFFKILGQAGYSLATLQFSIAGEHFCSATNAALAGIAKLSLDLSLLFLHLTRLLTLMVVVFYPQIILLMIAAATIALLLSGEVLLGASFILIGLGVICFNLSCLLDSNNQDKDMSNSIQELKEYERMSNEIYEEKNFIHNKIIEIVVKQEHELLIREKQVQQLSGQRYKLFTSTSPNQLPPPDTLELLELIDYLYKSMNTYPKFFANRSKEFGYVAYMYNELQEHHATTLLLADELFQRIEGAEYRRDRLFNNLSVNL